MFGKLTSTTSHKKSKKRSIHRTKLQVKPWRHGRLTTCTCRRWRQRWYLGTIPSVFPLHSLGDEMGLLAEILGSVIWLVGNKIHLLNDDKPNHLLRKVSLNASFCAFCLLLPVDTKTDMLPACYTPFSRGFMKTGSEKNGMKRIPLSTTSQRYHWLTMKEWGDCCHFYY